MKKLVLLVDDDQGIRDALSELLEMEGYEVEAARDGSEGLALLSSLERGPDLVLLDLMMPVVDGLEFRRRQREANLRLEVPVVLMSADGKVATKGEGTGVCGHIRKPMDITEVLEVVKRHCG